MLIHDMVTRAIHLTQADKKQADAERARNRRAKNRAKEENLLRRHPDRTAFFAKGKIRQLYLKQIKEGEVVLLSDEPFAQSDITDEEGEIDGTHEEGDYSDCRSGP